MIVKYYMPDSFRNEIFEFYMLRESDELMFFFLARSTVGQFSLIKILFELNLLFIFRWSLTKFIFL